MKTAKEFSAAGLGSASGRTLILDKLEQLGTSKHEGQAQSVGAGGSGVSGVSVGDSETISALWKRARAKYYSNALAVRLSNLDSPLKKGYIATFFCASGLTQDGTKITSRYCGHRWCGVCNRIRVTKLIKGYEKPLSALQDLRFVTLTVPNVPGEHLRETIERMTKQAQRIQGYFKKRHQRGMQGWQLVGIRKLECTSNAETGLFHPHFHFIIQGKEAAQGLVSEWLMRIETATAKAQDERKADKGSEKELFKYFTKLVTKLGGQYVTLLEPIDIIFQAMRGLRVFQPIGLKKDLGEGIEELQAVEVSGIAPSSEQVLWQWDRSDWVNHETGEGLTGYIPSENAQELVNNIALNVGEFQARELLKRLENGAKTVQKQISKPRLMVDNWEIPNLEKHRQRVFQDMDILEDERTEARRKQGLFSMAENGVKR